MCPIVRRCFFLYFKTRATNHLYATVCAWIGHNHLYFVLNEKESHKYANYIILFNIISFKWINNNNNYRLAMIQNTKMHSIQLICCFFFLLNFNCIAECMPFNFFNYSFPFFSLFLSLSLLLLQVNKSASKFSQSHDYHNLIRP